MTLHIIVPVYNAAQYLLDAVNSIVSELPNVLFPVQMVLINDGSTDNSEEICIKLASEHPWIHYIHQENKGVSVARNVALQYIFDNFEEDDWVGFLDADDIWYSNWGSVIEEGLNSDADVIGFGMAFADSVLNITEMRPANKKTVTGGYDTSVSENRMASFGAYLYKCKLLHYYHIAFIPQVTNGEDLIFKYEAFLCANKLTYYTNPLYVYRKNEHSVTSNYTRNALEYYDVLLLGWRGYLQWLESMDQSEDVTRAISFVKQRINCTCMYAARNFCIWHNGSYKDFLRNIIGELWLKQMISPVSFGDKSLRNDYCLINKRPLLFYIKYRLKSLFCWEM